MKLSINLLLCALLLLLTPPPPPQVVYHLRPRPEFGFWFCFRLLIVGWHLLSSVLLPSGFFLVGCFEAGAAPATPAGVSAPLVGAPAIFGLSETERYQQAYLWAGRDKVGSLTNLADRVEKRRRP